MPFSKNCKFCGKEGLHWETVNGKWLLYDSKNQKHSCKPKAPQREINPGAKIYILKDFNPDPLINKALVKFGKTLKKK